jgi:diketogulonate reductase-like aldo/keto reductase
VAKEQNTSVARVSLAWVQGRPGVASTILGARTLEQLDNNLGALDVKLTPEQVKALDDESQPTLNFPAAFLQGAPSFMHAGLRVNGVQAPPSNLTPKANTPRY